MQGTYIAKVIIGAVVGAVVLTLFTLIIVPFVMPAKTTMHGDLPPETIAAPLMSLLSSLVTVPIGAFLGSFSATILIAIQQHRWKDACRLAFTSVACCVFGLILLYAAFDMKTLIGVMTLTSFSVVWAAAQFLTGAWSLFMYRRREVTGA